MLLGKQELLTLSFIHNFNVVRVAQSLVVCAVLLFVLLNGSVLSILRFITSDLSFGTNASLNISFLLMYELYCYTTEYDSNIQLSCRLILRQLQLRKL